MPRFLPLIFLLFSLALAEGFWVYAFYPPGAGFSYEEAGGGLRFYAGGEEGAFSVFVRRGLEGGPAGRGEAYLAGYLGPGLAGEAGLSASLGKLSLLLAAGWSEVAWERFWPLLDREGAGLWWQAALRYRAGRREVVGLELGGKEAVFELELRQRRETFRLGAGYAGGGFFTFGYVRYRGRAAVGGWARVGAVFSGELFYRERERRLALFWESDELGLLLEEKDLFIRAWSGKEGPGLALGLRLAPAP